MKINSINSYNALQTSFLGNKLYRDIKKDLIKKPELQYLISQAEKEDRFMGSLPKEWISKFKKGQNKDTIKENTEKVYKAFARFAEDAAQTPIWHTFSCKYYKTGLYNNLKDKRGKHYIEPAEEWSKNIGHLQNALKEVFEDDCNIQYIDDASFGVVLKITIGGKPCALKAFFPDEKLRTAGNSKGHGALLEIRNAIHTSNTLKASQTSRFYCAKIPIGMETDGFILTSYEEPSKEIPGAEQRMQWLAKDRLYWGRFNFHDSHRDNFINGKVIDFGAIWHTFSSPKAQKMAKEFFTLISRGDTEAVKEFRQEHEVEPEFEECMTHLKEYMGDKEDLEDLETFAEHCYTRQLTKKIVASFKALGADYSKFENADFSEIEIEKHRKKLEEIFGTDEKSGSVSFCGKHKAIPQEEREGARLYHFLKKRLYEPEELDKILSNLNDDEKYLGSLPKSWVEQFGDGEKNIKTREIQEAFSKFSTTASKEGTKFVAAVTKLNDIMLAECENEEEEELKQALIDETLDYISIKPSIRYAEPMQELKREIEKILCEPCEIEYENKGGYGVVFKIEALGEKLALKIYFKNNGSDVTPSTASHGQLMEVASAIHLNSSMKKAQCSKFYCAKITRDGEEGGFLLTSFEDKKDGEDPAKKLTEREKWFTGEGRIPRRFVFSDTTRLKIGQNVIGGKLVDYGGVRYSWHARDGYEFEKNLYRRTHPPKKTGKAQ